MEISHLCRFSVVLISVFLCTASIITTEGDSRIIYVKEGSPFELTCLLTFFEWPKWQLEGRDLPSALSGDYVTETNKTESGVTSRLYVQHAHILHTGNYRCTAFRTDGHRVIVLSAAGLKANWDKDQTKIMLYHSKLILQCNSTDPTETDLRVKWSKDGIPIKANERIHINEAERKLTVTKTNDDDVGKYTCEATNSKSNVSDNKADIIILGRPYVKMQSELSVVEGTTLRLECHVWGHPKPDVKWYIGSNGSEVQPSSRVSFEPWNNVSNAVIIIKEAEMSDRASFNCTAVNEASKDGLPAFAVTTVRIKDKLAALWPFLGICAEVVVLCTIILIYEKKRNKTELDESDTDQSPEQARRSLPSSSSPPTPATPEDPDVSDVEKADETGDRERWRRSESSHETTGPPLPGSHSGRRLPDRRQPPPFGGDAFSAMAPALKGAALQGASQRDEGRTSPRLPAASRRGTSRSQTKSAQSTRTATRQNKKCVAGCRMTDRWKNSLFTKSSVARLSVSDSSGNLKGREGLDQLNASSGSVIDNVPYLKRAKVEPRTRRKVVGATEDDRSLSPPDAHGIIVTVTGPTPCVSRTASWESCDINRTWVAPSGNLIQCILPEDLPFLITKIQAEQKKDSMRRKERRKRTLKKSKPSNLMSSNRQTLFTLTRNEVAVPAHERPRSSQGAISRSLSLNSSRCLSPSPKSPRRSPGNTRRSPSFHSPKAKHNHISKTSPSSSPKSRTPRTVSLVNTAIKAQQPFGSYRPGVTKRSSLCEHHREIHCSGRMDSVAARCHSTTKKESSFYPYLNKLRSTESIRTSKSSASLRVPKSNQLAAVRNKSKNGAKGRKAPSRKNRCIVHRCSKGKSSQMDVLSALENRRLLRHNLWRNRFRASLTNLTDVVCSIPRRPYLPRRLFRSHSFTALGRTPRGQSLIPTEKKEIVTQFSVVHISSDDSVFNDIASSAAESRHTLASRWNTCLLNRARTWFSKLRRGSHQKDQSDRSS